MPAELGKPSISAPRSGERDVALAINNIRERIEAIEDSVRRLSALLAGSQASTSDAGSAVRSLTGSVSALRLAVQSLQSGAPVAVHVNGELIGVRNIVDFVTDGAGVTLIGQATDDRVIVRVAVGSYVVTAEPAHLLVGGGDATFSV